MVFLPALTTCVGSANRNPLSGRTTRNSLPLDMKTTWSGATTGSEWPLDKVISNGLNGATSRILHSVLSVIPACLAQAPSLCQLIRSASNPRLSVVAMPKLRALRRKANPRVLATDVARRGLTYMNNVRSRIGPPMSSARVLSNFRRDARRVASERRPSQPEIHLPELRQSAHGGRRSGVQRWLGRRRDGEGPDQGRGLTAGLRPAHPFNQKPLPSGTPSPEFGAGPRDFPLSLCGQGWVAMPLPSAMPSPELGAGPLLTADAINTAINAAIVPIMLSFFS